MYDGKRTAKPADGRFGAGLGPGPLQAVEPELARVEARNPQAALVMAVLWYCGDGAGQRTANRRLAWQAANDLALAESGG